MASLVPRIPDLAEVFGIERLEHMIRVEDSMTEQQYQVRAEMPGMDPAKDIHVDIDHGMLRIHAERREEQKAAGRSEFRYGMMERSIQLPGNADEDHIEASYNKGILEVTVPLKMSEPAARSIQVSSKQDM